MDNIYVYKPLPSVRTLYYMDVDFYRYFIGRDDQSGAPVGKPASRLFLRDTRYRSFYGFQPPLSLGLSRQRLHQKPGIRTVSYTHLLLHFFLRFKFRIAA